MHKIILFLLSLFQCVAAAQPTLAKEHIAQCPNEIRTNQSALEAPSAWAASNEQTRYPLTTIRFSDGSPSEIVWLAPDKSSRSGAQEWNLLPSDRGYWVVCGYGNTSVILSKKLSEKIRKCTISLDKSFSPPIATKYECK